MVRAPGECGDGGGGGCDGGEGGGGGDGGDGGGGGRGGKEGGIEGGKEGGDDNGGGGSEVGGGERGSEVYLPPYLTTRDLAALPPPTPATADPPHSLESAYHDSTHYDALYWHMRAAAMGHAWASANAARLLEER